MIGSNNESTILINSQSCKALIDTGSTITTMCDQFYNSIDLKPEQRSKSDFHFNIAGASGSKIPYIGYIKVEAPNTNRASHRVLWPSTCNNWYEYYQYNQGSHL